MRSRIQGHLGAVIITLIQLLDAHPDGVDPHGVFRIRLHPIVVVHPLFLVGRVHGRPQGIGVVRIHSVAGRPGRIPPVAAAGSRGRAVGQQDQGRHVLHLLAAHRAGDVPRCRQDIHPGVHAHVGIGAALAAAHGQPVVPGSCKCRRCAAPTGSGLHPDIVPTVHGRIVPQREQRLRLQAVDHHRHPGILVGIHDLPDGSVDGVHGGLQTALLAVASNRIVHAVGVVDDEHHVHRHLRLAADLPGGRQSGKRHQKIGISLIYRYVPGVAGKDGISGINGLVRPYPARIAGGRIVSQRTRIASRGIAAGLRCRQRADRVLRQ